MADLAHRRLGKTDMDVTVLAYGSMELRGSSRGKIVSDSDAEAVLHAVLDSGINLIDTSIDYGLSEERIGKFLSRRRAEYFLASKCGCVVGGAKSEHLNTAENVRAGVENSLRLMKTDYLDLVQFHRSLTAAEYAEHGALEAALQLRDEGKVRYVGVSATLPNMEEQIDMEVFQTFQVPYSCLQREHEDVIARAAGAGAGIIIRGGIARGAAMDSEQGRERTPAMDTMRDLWDRAGLDDLLDGASPTEFTLRFTLSHPGVDTTIVGTSNVDHLRANLVAAAKGPLPDDVLTEAKRRLEDAEEIAGS